jgi:type I restriction enzyme M protein
MANAAIGNINSVLHGLESRIAAGTSTITDPAVRAAEWKVCKFSLVLANFPFSDEFWWLGAEQRTDDKKKKDKLIKETFGKEGYKDPFGRFGRGTPLPCPPANAGGHAFILHILASLNLSGRASVVCPHGYPGISWMVGQGEASFPGDGIALPNSRGAKRRTRHARHVQHGEPFAAGPRQR